MPHLTARHWQTFKDLIPRGQPFKVSEIGYRMGKVLKVGGSTGYVYLGKALNWALRQPNSGLRRVDRLTWIYEPIHSAA